MKAEEGLRQVAVGVGSHGSKETLELVFFTKSLVRYQIESAFIQYIGEHIFHSYRGTSRASLIIFPYQIIYLIKIPGVGAVKDIALLFYENGTTYFKHKTIFWKHFTVP